jgi:hypothetical protein
VYTCTDETVAPISFPPPQNEHKAKNPYISVNSISTNQEKTFQFIAGVVNNGDQPFLSNISANFCKKLKLPQ